MADINRIKNNIRSMVDQGAPESDIDGYIASEGVSLEELQAPSNAMPAPTSNGICGCFYTNERRDARQRSYFFA